MKKVSMRLSMLLSMLFIFGTFVACTDNGDLDEEKTSTEVTVQLVMDSDEYEDISLADLTITLTDSDYGTSQSATTDATGLATFEVAFGTYIAYADYTIDLGAGTVLILNGSTEQIKASKTDSSNVNAELTLKASTSGSVIISEVYISGTYYDDASSIKSYNDQYIKLYNNTNITTYLDGICIGTAYPYTSAATNKWVDDSGNILDGVAIGQSGWMFPGDGDDYPIAPGEEVVVCRNAIDLSADMTDAYVVKPINLSTAGWAIYSDTYTTSHSAPSAGVNSLDCFVQITSMALYMITPISPAIFLYHTDGMDTETFVSTYRTNYPGSTNAILDCLFIPSELVLDGVEMMGDAANTKRVVSSIDNGYILAGGMYSHTAYGRVVDYTTEDGRIVYKDTNNSTNDFYQLDKPSLEE
ncbi:MAG: DUF4876 domain-containing protein [Rikenellaceae bacterium]